jgi:hypothetical protein
MPMCSYCKNRLLRTELGWEFRKNNSTEIVDTDTAACASTAVNSFQVIFIAT